MLPENVANKIKVASFSLLAWPTPCAQGIFPIVKHNNVSILYSDIKGFTSWTAERSASVCAKAPGSMPACIAACMPTQPARSQL